MDKTNKDITTQQERQKTPASSVYSLGDHRVLTGMDRTKFVTSVRDSAWNPECADQETLHISRKVQNKVSKLVALQSDQSHLTKHALPPVAKVYKTPVIQCGVPNARSNLFVVTNDAHSRQTLNGYSRREDNGNFFCH